MASLIKYHGSKYRIAPWIVSMMPEHKCYVEPFGGSAAVLLCKKPALVDVYNDLNQELVHIFKTIRDRGEELAEALYFTPYARDEYYQSYDESTDEVERARRFIVRSCMCISTTGTTHKAGFKAAINSRDHASHALTWSKKPEILFQVKKRFARVIIENIDAFTLFDRYDSPTTLWYLDPPYTKNERSGSSNTRGYQYDFNTEDHKRLLLRIKRLQGFVMLSAYQNELYDTELENWFVSQKKARTDSNIKPAIETLYLNYRPQGLLF